jgi:hypothetical protein
MLELKILDRLRLRPDCTFSGTDEEWCALLDAADYTEVHQALTALSQRNLVLWLRTAGGRSNTAILRVTALLPGEESELVAQSERPEVVWYDVSRTTAR